MYFDKGDYNRGLAYFERSLAIQQEIGDKKGMVYSLSNIGIVYIDKGDYDKAEEYLEKSLALQKEIGLGEHNMLFKITTYLHLVYKHVNKEYDEEEVYALKKEAKNIEFGHNLQLFKLLDDKSYLKTAYNQVQDKASAMDGELTKKFLSYPIPKAIVGAWEKVK